MSDAVKVGFVPLSTAPRGVLVVFCDDTLKFGPATRKALGEAAGTVKRAAAANQFKGKNGSILDILAPEGIKIQRLIVIGTGKGTGLKETDFLKFGGLVAGKLNAASDQVTILAELPDDAMTAEQAASVASGLRLRAYKFTRYKTKKKDGEDATVRAEVSHRGRRRQCGAQGVCAGIPHRRRRHHRARTRQRAAERALSRKNSPAAPRN